MQFDEVAALRKHSPAWRLLRADNAALILGFLGRVFVENDVKLLGVPVGRGQRGDLRERLRAEFDGGHGLAAADTRVLLGRHRHPRVPDPGPAAREAAERAVDHDGPPDAACTRTTLGARGVAGQRCT
ncbi:DUF3375 family protein [Skermania sp. ID1734]|nr:DUF3375 family protein [Skermania sp. ID1734]